MIMLSDLLDKLTSYNLFNYLLPGAVFAYFAERSLGVRLVPEDLVTAAFVYYFLGVVVSRFGSLALEPFLKKIGFVKFEPYAVYISASERDSKIEVLMEAANMYRTLVSAMMLLLMLTAYLKLETFCPALTEWRGLVGVSALALVFLLAYKKQTNYIAGRVRKHSG